MENRVASNKNTLINNLGGEDAYREYMRKLAAMPHRRGGKSKPKDLAKRIEVYAIQEGVPTPVYVRRVLKNV